MNNATTLTEEQAKALQTVQAMNLDEVTNEVIAIKVVRWQDEPVFDDEGNPFCDEDGKQYVGRVVAGTRTAKIKNIVPVDVYNEAVGLSGSLQSGMPSRETLEKMTELVWRIWRISEPFMTMDMIRNGVDGEHLLALFTRFFNRGSRQ